MWIDYKPVDMEIDVGNTGNFHVFEMRILNLNLIITFFRCLSSSEKGQNGDSNPDLCDAGAVLHQLSYQTNWEQVVMWLDYKPRWEDR